MGAPRARAGLVVVLLAGALSGCGENRDPTDGDALTACHEELTDRGVTGETWPTTTRVQDPGWVVNVWTTGPAEGTPNYVCRVEPTDDGVRVTEVRP